MSAQPGSGERLMAVLDLFDEARPEWSPAEMMERLGYARPTLYRYLKLLREAGLLVSLPGGAYVIGPRVVELDYLVRRSDPTVRSAQPHLTALAERFPGTAFLCRWYEGKLLCVASETREAAPRSSYPRGRPMPLLRGAVSKAILAHLPRRRQRQMIEGSAQTAEDLRSVRRSGVATAHGEVTPGIVGTAAPVLDPLGYPLAALCVSMPAAAYARIDTALLASAVIGAANHIAAALAPTDLEAVP